MSPSHSAASSPQIRKIRKTARHNRLIRAITPGGESQANEPDILPAVRPRVFRMGESKKIETETVRFAGHRSGAQPETWSSLTSVEESIRECVRRLGRRQAGWSCRRLPTSIGLMRGENKHRFVKYFRGRIGGLRQKTVNRLVDVFPPQQAPQIRSMVSESLRSVISQQLLRRARNAARSMSQAGDRTKPPRNPAPATH
jgi:hypothetical protein